MCHFIQVRDFHAVGQGLFASGELHSRDSGSVFRWVYDCGSDSKPSPLNKRIRDFRSALGTEHPAIDLLAVSHFDSDHINGLAELLAGIEVETVLMPYIPLHQRLILAFAAGVDSSQPQFGFFINPVEFIDRTAPGSVKQFVFVLPHEGETPVDAFEGRSLPEVDDWSEAFYSQHDESAQAELRLLTQGTGRPGAPRVRLLPPSGRLLVSGAWEFVPYSELRYAPKVSPALMDLVEDLKSDLCGSPSEAEIQSALSSIKAEYDNTFGSSARMRNAISMFLYSGPLPAARNRNVCDCCRGYGFDDSRVAILRGHGRFCSTLYTGDGNLKPKIRLRHLRECLGDDRVLGVGCLQVAHHGSRWNWHSGLASKMTPGISVFSSQPDHPIFGHPHAEVVLDFLPFTPLQVDAKRPLQLVCWECPTKAST